MKSATPDPIEAIPGIPDDDLPDTVTAPPEATAPLPEPTLQQVRDDLKGLARVFDSGLEKLPAFLDAHTFTKLRDLLETERHTVSATDAGALQHLIETLAAIHDDGVTVSGSPYQATVEGRTPAGFRVTVTIQRTDGAAFLDSLGKLEAWLLSQHYTPTP